MDAVRSAAFYQFEIQNTEYTGTKCKVSISNTVEYCSTYSAASDTMGSRNPWRGDARPRTVRQALLSPSPATPVAILTILFLVCFSTIYFYTLITSIRSTTSYEYECECLIDIN